MDPFGSVVAGTKNSGDTSAFANKACDERNDCHDGEDEEENLCDFDSTGSNAAKAENGCDECNDEKDDGVVQHVDLL